MNPAKQLAESWVATVDEFVPPLVCRRLVGQLTDVAWLPSDVAGVDAQQALALHSGRASSTAVLERPSGSIQEVLLDIERSLYRTFGVRRSRLESWQVTRYATGESYDYHLDCGRWRRHPSGERRRTILIYLERPQRGGATDFRALGLRVMPVVGRLVIWNNLLSNGRCNHAMIHAGCKVSRGQKIILTTWERERRFEPYPTRRL